MTAPRWLAIAFGTLGVLGACQHDLADVDGAFYAHDGTRVHCAINLDSEAENSLASIDSGLDRALERGEVIELYAHHPGGTVPVDVIEHVLAGATNRDLTFFTYADLA